MADYANNELERTVLSHFIRFDNSLQLSKELFTSDEAQELYKFVTENRRIISDIDELWDIWEIDLKRKGLPIPTHKKYIENIFLEDQISDDDIEYYLDQIRAFASVRQLYGVYESSFSSLKAGDPLNALEQLERGINTMKSEYPTETIYRTDFTEDVGERIINYRQKKKGKIVSKIPTGIKKIDERITGIAPQSLNIIQGETNIGKTFFLQELALQGFRFGLKVLFVTIELNAQVLEARWDARIANLNVDKIDSGRLTHKEEEQWQTRLKGLSKFTKKGGRLGIVAIPEGCTIQSLETELLFRRKKWGSDVEMVVIDYLDLMDSGRKNFTEQEAQGNIARDLQRFCKIKDVIVWTATQVAGRSYGKGQLDLSDVGYSKKKAMFANLFLGISASKDDMEEGALRVKVLKNTVGVKDISVVLSPRYDKGMIDQNND